MKRNRICSFICQIPYKCFHCVRLLVHIINWCRCNWCIGIWVAYIKVTKKKSEFLWFFFFFLMLLWYMVAIMCFIEGFTGSWVDLNTWILKQGFGFDLKNHTCLLDLSLCHFFSFLKNLVLSNALLHPHEGERKNNDCLVKFRSS